MGTPIFVTNRPMPIAIIDKLPSGRRHRRNPKFIIVDKAMVLPRPSLFVMFVLIRTPRGNLLLLSKTQTRLWILIFQAPCKHTAELQLQTSSSLDLLFLYSQLASRGVYFL